MMEIIDGKLHVTATELDKIARMNSHKCVAEVLRIAGVEAMSLEIARPEIVTAANHNLIVEVPEGLIDGADTADCTMAELDQAIRQSTASLVEIMY
jgi:hypothetical protein